MNELNFKPINGRVVVEAQEEEFSSGGIALPSMEEKPQVGTVVAIDLIEDHLFNNDLKPGTKIIFNRFAATKLDKDTILKLKLTGKEYLTINKDSISIIFKDEQWKNV